MFRYSGSDYVLVCTSEICYRFIMLRTYRVSKVTDFPTIVFLSHSREGNAPGSSILLLALEAILGAGQRYHFVDVRRLAKKSMKQVVKNKIHHTWVQ